MDVVGLLLGLLYVATLAFKVFALIDAAVRPDAAYSAAEKQTKTLWLVLLGLAVGIQLLSGNLFGPLGINLFGLVAAIVYIVDVRPAVRALGRGGRGGGDGRHMGPYGPW